MGSSLVAIALIVGLTAVSAQLPLPSTRGSFSEYAAAVKTLEEVLPATQDSTDVRHVSEVRDYLNTLREFLALYEAEDPPNLVTSGQVIRLKERKDGAAYVERYRSPPGAKYIVFGDLHGHIQTLVRSLVSKSAVNDDWTLRGAYHIIVNGDFVDRGVYSIEVVHVLLRLKVVNPERVHIVSGNHELSDIASSYGFGMQVAKYVADDFARFGASQVKMNAFGDVIKAYQKIVDGLIDVGVALEYRKLVMKQCINDAPGNVDKCYHKRMKAATKQFLEASRLLPAKDRIGLRFTGALPRIGSIRWTEKIKRGITAAGEIGVIGSDWSFMSPSDIEGAIGKTLSGCTHTLSLREMKDFGSPCAQAIATTAFMEAFSRVNTGIVQAYRSYANSIFLPDDRTIITTGLRFPERFRMSKDDAVALASVFEGYFREWKGEKTSGPLEMSLDDMNTALKESRVTRAYDKMFSILVKNVLSLIEVKSTFLEEFLGFTRYLPQALYIQVNDVDSSPEHVMFVHGGPNLAVDLEPLLRGDIPRSNNDVNKNTLRLLVPSNYEQMRSIKPFEGKYQEYWQGMYPQMIAARPDLVETYRDSHGKKLTAKGMDPVVFARDAIRRGPEGSGFGELVFGDGFLWTDMLLVAEAGLENSHVGYLNVRGLSIGREVVRAYKEKWGLKLIVRAHQHSGYGSDLLQGGRGAARLWKVEGHNLAAHTFFKFAMNRKPSALPSERWWASVAVPLSDFGPDEVLFSVATSGSGLGLNQDAFLEFSPSTGFAHNFCHHGRPAAATTRNPGGCWRTTTRSSMDLMEVSDDDTVPPPPARAPEGSQRNEIVRLASDIPTVAVGQAPEADEDGMLGGAIDGFDTPSVSK